MARMTRVSPPDEAREFPGPQASRRDTRAPRLARCRAAQPPNAPAPTTATLGAPDAAARDRRAAEDGAAPTAIRAAAPFSTARRERAAARSRLLEALDIVPGQDAGGDHLLQRRLQVLRRGAPRVLQHRATHRLV